jgi:hypothetical protein
MKTSVGGPIAVAWNNGKRLHSGAGFGLKISTADRDFYFSRECLNVRLCLPGTDRLIAVNINKGSFWNGTCRELISAEIGRWMLREKIAPWPRGNPPRFRLVPKEQAIFVLHVMEK